MSKIGIMQGRLSPPENGRFQCFPRNSWREEFQRAQEAGLDCIEWIDDTYGADVNPLRTEQGIKEMQNLAKQTGVGVLSICADSFMEEPLIRCTPAQLAQRLNLLRHLLQQSKKLGVQHVGIPFVDNSALKTADEIKEAADAINTVLPEANALGVEIQLETNLAPIQQPDLLKLVPGVKITYDIGNSSSLGYDPREEFAAYGNEIGSVHMKDRLRGAGTVPLGEGDADLDAVAVGLRAIKYKGLFILQVARQTDGQEVEWARHNKEFVLSHFHGSAS